MAKHRWDEHRTRQWGGSELIDQADSGAGRDGHHKHDATTSLSRFTGVDATHAPGAVRESQEQRS